MESNAILWESNCGDGINSWSPGVLLGRIVFDGGVANFCFGGGGWRDIYIE